MSPQEIIGTLQVQHQQRLREYKQLRSELAILGQSFIDLGQALKTRPDDFETVVDVGPNLVVTTADQGLICVWPYPDLDTVRLKRDKLRDLRLHANELAQRLGDHGINAERL